MDAPLITVCSADSHGTQSMDRMPFHPCPGYIVRVVYHSQAASDPRLAELDCRPHVQRPDHPGGDANFPARAIPHGVRNGVHIGSGTVGLVMWGRGRGPPHGKASRSSHARPMPAHGEAADKGEPALLIHRALFCPLCPPSSRRQARAEVVSDQTDTPSNTWRSSPQRPSPWPTRRELLRWTPPSRPESTTKKPKPGLLPREALPPRTSEPA